MAKTCLALRHVHFEDLGSFAVPLSKAVYALAYGDVGDPDFCGGDVCLQADVTRPAYLWAS